MLESRLILILSTEDAYTHSTIEPLRGTAIFHVTFIMQIQMFWIQKASPAPSEGQGMSRMM